MKVLNLYAGIGGNRKLWTDVDVTAVEYNQEIAAIYSDFFPDDTVIVDDAHQYLLDHYKEFDFIWSSPPCPSHSGIRHMASKRGDYPPIYPDFSLWQEVTLLKHFVEIPYVVENVKPYYDPIVQPTFKMDRHFFWANFYVDKLQFADREIIHKNIKSKSVVHGTTLSKYSVINKTQILRNMVNPEVGLHIFETAMKLNTHKKGKQLALF